MTFSIPNADLAYLLDGYLIDEDNYRRVLDSVVRDPVNTVWLYQRNRDDIFAWLSRQNVADQLGAHLIRDDRLKEGLARAISAMLHDPEQARADLLYRWACDRCTPKQQSTDGDGTATLA